MAWMKAGTDLVYITKIEINGIPVWRDERLHHIEIETVCGSSTSHLERCLSL